MKRREARSFGDDFESKWLIEILKNEVDGAVHPLDVIKRLATGFSTLVSQDL